MLRLHVLGPAFGLPSIDAECNAAVSLLRAVFGVDNEGWEILVVDDERKVPCLVDGHHSLQGFSNISRYLSKKFPDAIATLDERQYADSNAITSFLNSQAPILLAIQLYVSFDNYRNTTRSAFTAILPWHANYTVPPRVRAAARRRTEHLGVSSIDVDNVHENVSNQPEELSAIQDQEFEKAAQKRASLLLPKRETLRSMLQRPEHAAVFKLQNLANNFFEPLSDMLGDKQYLLNTNTPTSVDCLAYGYLSLMLFANVPQDWLGRTMKDKYGRLAAYTRRIHENLGLATKVEDVVVLMSCKTKEEIENVRRAKGMALPWSGRPIRRVTDIIGTMTRDLCAHIPLFGTSIAIVSVNQKQPSIWQRLNPILFATCTAGLAVGAYYLVSSRTLVWPRGEDVLIVGRKRLSDYGHLGAALSGMAMLSNQAMAERGGADLQRPRIANADSDGVVMVERTA